MKKSNKKGFTIVELVIVIAVIAILAAVLIPTFSNVVNNAKKSAAMQEARNAYEEYIAGKDGKNLDLENTNLCIKSGDYYFHVENGQFKTDALAVATGTECSKTSYKVDGGKLVEDKSGDTFVKHTHAGA